MAIRVREEEKKMDGISVIFIVGIVVILCMNFFTRNRDKQKKDDDWAQQNNHQAGKNPKSSYDVRNKYDRKLPCQVDRFKVEFPV
jgi:hypothetical protein